MHIAWQSLYMHVKQHSTAQAHLYPLSKAYRTLLGSVPPHGLLQPKQQLVVQPAAMHILRVQLHLLHEGSLMGGERWVGQHTVHQLQLGTKSLQQIQQLQLDIESLQEAEYAVIHNEQSCLPECSVY